MADRGRVVPESPELFAGSCGVRKEIEGLTASRRAAAGGLKRIRLMIALRRQEPDRNIYERAFDVMHCHDLVKILRHICEDLPFIIEEVAAKGEDTWITSETNQHPLCRLYGNTIARVTGLGGVKDVQGYEAALQVCRLQVGTNYVFPKETTLDDLFKEDFGRDEPDRDPTDQ